MKKFWLTVLSIITISGIACGAYYLSTKNASPLASESENDNAFTLQQITEALTPQLDFGQERPIDWEVISAERVGINPEGTASWFEPAGQYVDISGSVRYRVTIKWADEPNYPEAEYVLDYDAMNAQAGQYFRDNPDVAGGVPTGDDGPLYFIWMRNPQLGTTQVSEWDFFIVDGKPELVFVVC